jgi:hypothetical protein
MLWQVPTVIHLLIKDPNDLHFTFVLAVENDIPAKGTRTTSGKQLFSRTALAAFRIVADLVQRRLDQTVVTFELKLPPFPSVLLKSIFNLPWPPV